MDHASSTGTPRGPWPAKAKPWSNESTVFHTKRRKYEKPVVKFYLFVAGFADNTPVRMSRQKELLQNKFRPPRLSVCVHAFDRERQKCVCVCLPPVCESASVWRPGETWRYVARVSRWASVATHEFCQHRHHGCRDKPRALANIHTAGVIENALKCN